MITFPKILAFCSTWLSFGACFLLYQYYQLKQQWGWAAEYGSSNRNLAFFLLILSMLGLYSSVQYLKKSQYDNGESNRDLIGFLKVILYMSAVVGGSLFLLSTSEGTGSNVEKTKIYVPEIDKEIEKNKENYSGRVRARIKPNITYLGRIDDNAIVGIEIKVNVNAEIVGASIVSPSGNAVWDRAVLDAVKKTEVLPRGIAYPAAFVVDFKSNE